MLVSNVKYVSYYINTMYFQVCDIFENFHNLISQRNFYISPPLKQQFSAKGDFLLPTPWEGTVFDWGIGGLGCYWHLGIPINILQCTGQHCTTKIIPIKREIVPRLRNPALEPPLMLLMKQSFHTFHSFLKKNKQTNKSLSNRSTTDMEARQREIPGV